MKRERDDGDAEASSDDEIGPMPTPDAQVVKKKRKGKFKAPFWTGIDDWRRLVQYCRMREYF